MYQFCSYEVTAYRMLGFNQKLLINRQYNVNVLLEENRLTIKHLP